MRFKGHQAVYNAVNCGLLEPVTAIDANGNDLGTVYILTDWAKQRYDTRAHDHHKVIPFVRKPFDPVQTDQANFPAWPQKR